MIAKVYTGQAMFTSLINGFFKGADMKQASGIDVPFQHLHKETHCSECCFFAHFAE